MIHKGIEDLADGKESLYALLVSIGAPRLRRAGLRIPPAVPDADHKLYLQLAREFGDDAHSRYNAMIRRLVSFERTLECGS